VHGRRRSCTPSRQQSQAEIDLLLAGPRRRALAIETERFIVKPEGEAYSVGSNVEAVLLVESLERGAPRVGAAS